jgi:hypothetical protein
VRGAGQNGAIAVSNSQLIKIVINKVSAANKGNNNGIGECDQHRIADGLSASKF